MRVDSLSTTHFRNLNEERITFSPGVNLLVGDNGQGKTNALEAIHLFKYGRSFRTHRDAEMIRFGEPFCRVEVETTFAAGDRERFEASIEKSGEKKTKVSGREVARLSELVGRYPCVLFGPHDLRLASGQPADRRRFIDVVGSMTNPRYIELLKEYRRILQQRNAALKARAPREERDAWNTELVEKGCGLVAWRRDMVIVLETHMKTHAGELGLAGELALSYESAILRESEPMEGEDGVSMADVFAHKLAALEHDELRRGATLAGPHRDDMSMRLDGKDLRKFGSQGQRRLMTVLLKVAELSHLESELAEPCVLLLDDVFSEFDPGITEKLQHLLGGPRQVFVTSPVALDWAGKLGARVFTVSGGRIDMQGEQ